VDAWSRDSARLVIRTAEVRIAGKNHEYALERYKLGEIDNLARLKAQNDVISARLNRLIAEVNLKRLEIAVDKATANVLNRFGVKLK
jgi:outer membrane protein TolC